VNAEIERVPDPPPGPEPEPRRTLVEAAVNGSLALTRSIAAQPIMVGLLFVLVVVTGAFFVIAREERRARHAEVAMILDRCVPSR
jgi:hypothetical protein